MCEEKLPTYFINSADKIISATEILHCNWKTKQEYLTQDFLPAKTPVKILITSGASCPDAVVEDVIEKLTGFFNADEKIEELMTTFH